MLLSSKLPPKYPEGYALGDGAPRTAEFLERGWTYAEAAWSKLIKRHWDLVYDLGRMTGREMDRTDLIKACCKVEDRAGPVLPDEMGAALELKSFADAPRDRPLVAQLYRDVLARMLRRVRALHYSSLQWGDAEALQLCKLLRTGACSRLEELHLCGNRLGDKGLNGLAAVITSGVLPTLQLVTADRPNQFDLRKACDAMEVTLEKEELQLREARHPNARSPLRDAGRPTSTLSDRPGSRGGAQARGMLTYTVGPMSERSGGGTMRGGALSTR